MSSKGRPKADGTRTVLPPSEYYSTPDWCTDLLLEQPEIKELLESRDISLLEPCAGSGAIVDVINSAYHHMWDMVELRQEERAGLELLASTYRNSSEAFCPLSFFDFSVPYTYDAVITNPPFSLFESFLEKSLGHSDVVIMLLRQGILGSEKRHDFWQRHRPMQLLMSRRPSFTNDGKTDSSYYSWFCWGLGKQGTYRVI